jgi:hypothetical protein
VTGLRLRRLRKQLNARLKESVISKPATLKKLYNYPKEACARPHSLQHQERSRIVVQWLRSVVLLLRSLLLHLAPTPPAAAEQQLYITNLYERISSQRPIEHSTSFLRDNSYCMWLYSLKFVWRCRVIIGRYATPGVTRTDTVCAYLPLELSARSFVSASAGGKRASPSAPQVRNSPVR